MSSSISIEPMKQDHIPGLVKIENACFSRPWTHDGFAAELDSSTANFYVALSDGVPVGYIGFQAVLDEGYVDNIAVLPEYRRRGIAKKLMETAFERCAVLGLSFLSLEVRKSNAAAIALYESYQFKTEGIRKNFYSAPREDALMMTARYR